MMRNPVTPLVIAGLLLAGASGTALAQKATLDSRIEVRFEATPAAEVFRHIISGLGLEVQLDATIDDPVTLWVTNVSARTALNVVCESLGCGWTIQGTRLVVGPAKTAAGRVDEKVKWLGPQKKIVEKNPIRTKFDLRSRLDKPLPVDMQFQDVPVSSVLRALSEVAGLEITADEPVASKHVTMTGSGRTVWGAVKAVIDQAGGGAVTILAIKGREADSAPAIRIAVKSGLKSPTKQVTTIKKVPDEKK